MQTNNKMAVTPVGRLILQMSIPPLISMFLQYSYNLIDSAFIARLSENALTAVSLSFPITTLMNAASIWIGVGVNVLIAGYLGEKKQDEANTTVTHGLLPVMRFNYGAGSRERLHSAFRYGTALVSGMMILGTLTIILLPAQLLGLFTASEAMRSFGIPAMRIMAVSYLFCGWSTMISTYLQATEQVFPSMLIQLLRQFLLLIPFMWGLEKLLKITGIWLSFPVTETATFVLALLIFRAGRKKETLCSGTKTQ